MSARGTYLPKNNWQSRVSIGRTENRFADTRFTSLCVDGRHYLMAFHRHSQSTSFPVHKYVLKCQVLFFTTEIQLNVARNQQIHILEEVGYRILRHSAKHRRFGLLLHAFTMTLLTTDNRCWGANIKPESRSDNTTNGLLEKKEEILRQSSNSPSKERNKQARKNCKTRRSSQQSKASKPKSHIDALPIEVSLHIYLKKRQKARVRKQKTLPEEISFLSSSSVHSDLESETCLQNQRSIESVAYGTKSQLDVHNKHVCLELLESEGFDDNCVGMEHLLSLINRELVNSSSFASSDTRSIAYSLICDNGYQQNGGEFSRRLRDAFPSFLVEVHRKTHYAKGDSFDTESTASLSSSSNSSSSSSTTGSEHMNGSEHAVFAKTSLKLPALQILVSSLQLVTRTRRISRRQSSFSISMDMGDTFWRQILTYMTACLQDLVVQPGAKDSHSEEYPQNGSIEAALVVKGLRLLCKLQPEVMNSYVRYSLLPFLSSALEFGSEQQQQIKETRGHHRRLSGDKMLVKECERLLRSFL